MFDKFLFLFSFYNETIHPISCPINRFTLIYENCYIKNCIFKELSNNPNGGSIYISTTTTMNLLIENTLFNDCNTTGSTNGGGAIYFSSYGSSLLKKICSINCFITSTSYYGYGQFSFLQSGNLKINSLEFLSVLKCPGNHLGFRRSPIYIENGNQNINNINIFNNYSHQHAGMITSESNYFLSKFITFFKNIPILTQCFQIYNSNGNLSYSNIVENISPGGYSVILTQLNSNLYIKNCIFYNNSNLLLSIVTGGNIEVSNSFIIHLTNLIGNSNFYVNKLNNFEFTSTIKINYFSTYFCINQYDLILTTNNNFKFIFKYLIFLKFII